MASVLAHSALGQGFSTNFDLTGARAGACQSQQTDNRYRINHHGDLESDCGFILANSFQQLLTMYSSKVSGQPDPTNPAPDSLEDPPLIVAGGLQQYLIKNIKKNKETTEQPRKGAGSEYTTFHDLPDSLHLKIFSYLSLRELCVSSCVCRHWYCVGSDHVMWRDRLERDMQRWDVMSHTTNPRTYRAGEDNWTDKEIYLRCSPEVNRTLKQKYLNFKPLTNFLRTFWPKKAPRIAMFGPGLESDTRRITRMILDDKSGTFTTTAMFPGQFEGMGSGFTMRMASGATIHLMTLYTATRQERESRSRDERLRHSRLLDRAPPPGGADQSQAGEYEVRAAVRDLCRTVDGFVFVVDASQEKNTVTSAGCELRAMTSHTFVSPSVPVVVLSCVPDLASPRVVPCVDVARSLRLDGTTTPSTSDTTSRPSEPTPRPWQVRDCTVDTMAGVVDAMDWVIEHAHKANK